MAMPTRRRWSSSQVCARIDLLGNSGAWEEGKIGRRAMRTDTRIILYRKLEKGFGGFWWAFGDGGFGGCATELGSAIG